LDSLNLWDRARLRPPAKPPPMRYFRFCIMVEISYLFNFASGSVVTAHLLDPSLSSESVLPPYYVRTKRIVCKCNSPLAHREESEQSKQIGRFTTRYYTAFRFRNDKLPLVSSNDSFPCFQEISCEKRLMQNICC
jgi:hypothetical protein